MGKNCKHKHHGIFKITYIKNISVFLNTAEKHWVFVPHPSFFFKSTLTVLRGGGEWRHVKFTTTWWWSGTLASPISLVLYWLGFKNSLGTRKTINRKEIPATTKLKALYCMYFLNKNKVKWSSNKNLLKKKQKQSKLLKAADLYP